MTGCKVAPEDDDEQDAEDKRKTDSQKKYSGAPSESSSSSCGLRRSAEETSPQSPTCSASTQPMRRETSPDENLQQLQKKMAEKAAKRREAESKKNQAKFRRGVVNFMDGPWMTLISVSLTVWALIGDDLRILTTNRPADIVFNVVTIVCLS
ncbi:unnamed protein product, partial [Durusdinium trenchii]